MAADEPSMPVIVERIANVQEDVTDIKKNMATRTDQAYIDDRIRGLTGALERERAERVAAVEAEKQERIAADQKEAEEREKVAGRLQVVEDRMEARKYHTGSAIMLAVVAMLLGIFRDLIPPIGG
ncbi:hypothetical protein [Microbacterium sp. K24]|uniref:hypothetical protein n=1 Tax=Microbacterium sp. K24 TaxID=2305446 RepID=UPI00109C2409|nr:hypothetical protein [Microbacterium sp. K24]